MERIKLFYIQYIYMETSPTNSMWKNIQSQVRVNWCIIYILLFIIYIQNIYTYLNILKNNWQPRDKIAVGGIERDTCTPMFITALFIIARTWKKPRCPSVEEWIRKLWYIYTMEYYSTIKKNSFESVLMRWMKLEPIVRSEVSQKDKNHYSILTHIYGI